MPYYKDVSGNLHFLDDPAFEYLLPPVTQPISDEEATQILAPQKQVKVIAAPKIAELEGSTDFQTWATEAIKAMAERLGI